MNPTNQLQQRPKRILKCHSCGITGGSNSMACEHCGSLVTEIVVASTVLDTERKAEVVEAITTMVNSCHACHAPMPVGQFHICKREAESQQPEAPETIYVPLPYAAVCSTVNRPDLPQAEYHRVKTCRWTWNSRKEFWASECGCALDVAENFFELNCAPTAEHCLFCGGRLEVG